MNEQQQPQKQPSRPPRRTRVHSTKKRAVFRPPAHPWRWVAGILSTLTVIVIALVWGNILKQQSDAYRADKEADLWTLPPESSDNSPAALPDSHLLEINPEGNVGDIIIYNSHDGVVLPLRDAAGHLYYQSATATEAGLSVPSDAIPLAKDVSRVSGRGLRVVGVYHVTCFEPAETAVQTYRRGLDLALLHECAESGIHEILLMGLPCGNDADNARSVAFLDELNALLASLPDPPALGVALKPSAFESEPDPAETVDGVVYAGELSPGRLGHKVDYLALDLRDKTLEEMDDLLPRLSYIYGRHRLRMLVDRDDKAVTEDIQSHGFLRVYEMRTDE